MEPTWSYKKYDEENHEVKSCPTNDTDGSVTGHIVMGVKEWFDENPEERIRLGWTKHILHNSSEIEFNSQSQYVVKSIKRIDAYTVEDELHVLDKSEERMLLEDMMGSNFVGSGAIVFYGGEFT